MVITATGLNLLPLGGIELTVDGEAVPVPQRVAYKGMMLEGVPNMAFAIGYTNASWTLKVDLVAVMSPACCVHAGAPASDRHPAACPPGRRAPRRSST